MQDPSRTVWWRNGNQSSRTGTALWKSGNTSHDWFVMFAIPDLVFVFCCKCKLRHFSWLLMTFAELLWLALMFFTRKTIPPCRLQLWTDDKCQMNVMAYYFICFWLWFHFESKKEYFFCDLELWSKDLTHWLNLNYQIICFGWRSFRSTVISKRRPQSSLWILRSLYLYFSDAHTECAVIMWRRWCPCSHYTWCWLEWGNWICQISDFGSSLHRSWRSADNSRQGMTCAVISCYCS